MRGTVGHYATFGPVPAVAASLALVLLACGLLPGATPDGAEAQPGPGLAVIQGEPPITHEVTVIEFIAPDGKVFDEQTARIEPGHNIRASVWSLPEVVRVAVNGVVCDGEVTLESDLMMNVTARFDATGCLITTVGVEPLSR